MNHRKIAEIAHVSTSTVSKALSGSSDISNEVAEEIRRIALEIGYFSRRIRERSKINVTGKHRLPCFVLKLSVFITQK